MAPPNTRSSSSASPSRTIAQLSRSWRRQRTIQTTACISGVGLFTNAEVNVQFSPADENTGIWFCRQDNNANTQIPALIEHLVDTPRHTSIKAGDVSVEMVEHTLAALAGLQIDNCLVTVNGPELPGLDGSSAPTVNALLQAGIVEQKATIEPLVISQAIEVCDSRGGMISAQPAIGCNQLEITYLLDHPEQVIGRQSASYAITPNTFIDEIAPARTFVLHNEVEQLLAAGYGQKLTYRDLCVFGEAGLIDNTIRYANEPARHKLLDCVGDFVLAGRPIVGRVVASKSGHALNHRFIRELLKAESKTQSASQWDAA